MRGQSFRLIALATATAILTNSANAAQSSRANAQVEATVAAALSAAQSGDLQKLRGQYAPGCIFVDEFAPFSWSGPNAVDKYLSSAAQMYEETQHLDVKITTGSPSYVYVSGNHAYVIEPLTETAKVKGKQYQSSGSLVFTLVELDHEWKITSQTWAKVTENLNPY